MLMTLMMLALVQDADPLAPGRAGKVQCYDPVVAEKTCRAIGAYRFGPGDEIWNESQSLLGASPRIVLTGRTRVWVRDGAECARNQNHADEIVGIQVNGVALEDGQYETVRAQIGAALETAMGGGELCSTYHANDDGSLRATVTVGGVDRPEFESTVLWVDPAEWRLAD
ncbi:MAG: hypothetical protein KF910_12605 [Brevundimonas sp.]|uniref:hypothetical protein n=1 Tax=Brevundimonas sp. TaxID=1871086 RepID=UPI0025BDFFE4|nr:hypothetical protein [Brevundimonas sp.]MBX3478446.1 hypothetical protein [Brevundimonas sp.]